MPDDATAPVTAEGLRERAESAVMDWFNHLADGDEPTIEQIGKGVAAAVLAALAGVPGDLPARMAAEMQQHGLDEQTGDCICGEAVTDWDGHLAAAALSVRWEHAAAQAVEVERLRAELAEETAQLEALHKLANRSAEAAKRDRTERDTARLIVEELQALRDSLYGQLDSAQAERDALKAATDEVRRLCNLTIAVSCRRDAIDQAVDTLAVLDRALDAPETPESPTGRIEAQRKALAASGDLCMCGNPDACVCAPGDAEEATDG
jgi:hypothetical protein